MESINYGSVGSSFSYYLYKDKLLDQIDVQQKVHNKADITHIKFTLNMKF